MRELKYYVHPKKDFVVSKNANVSEERTFFTEHYGGNRIFLARLIPLLGQVLIEREIFALNLFLSDGRKSEREKAREGEGVEWRDVATPCYDLTG